MYNINTQRPINNNLGKQIRRELRKKQTPQEILLWARLRSNQTGDKWKRQVSIGPYVADFYCYAKHLVVELDGSQHLNNKEYDREREKYFILLGIQTLRFWNNEVNTNIEGVLIKILSTSP